ncbi:amidohydrolase family protein [Rutstroemia sp. NJR-2017a BBW]|nr:amidohydrolase family protein [Rutstroemia sp. NJR-2017a BBW]
MATNYPILDSHIHLFPASELTTLAWAQPSNPLYKQHSLEEYTSATASASSSLEGFIFLETDRINDLSAGEKDGSGWTHPLQEVSWLKRIALGQPREGEGHTPEHAKLCKAIVPWAPVPSGAEVLERYVERVREEAGDAWGRVKGFRFLVQDKARGTMLGEGFVEGVKWLGRKGLVFDLGVDLHSGGRWQLEEAAEMMERVHEGVSEEEKVTVVINHLCKPDFSIYNTQTDPSFLAWRTAMFKLSKFSKTYMKLSGCFSEMPDTLRNGPIDDIVMALQPYLAVLLATFGPFRIMFGSDWPVCTVGVGDGAWGKWREVVARFCDLASLSKEDQIMIWSGTAIKAYGIKELM